MLKNYRAGLVGVFGCPVDENPTVVIHEAAFRALHLNFRYLTLLVKPEDLEAAFKGLRALHFQGINLTVPHKIEALKFVDERAAEVKLIGATNTVVHENGRLIAYNTDGKGFVEGLHQRGVSLEGKRIALLGAGGAARAIAVESALHGASEIMVLNRDAEHGEDLARLINEKTECRASYLPWVGTAPVPSCDILINATSVGLASETDRPDIAYGDIPEGLLVQDVIPNPADTAFLKAARERGAVTMDGLSMLVNQAAIAFKLWTRHDAPIDVMKAAIEAEQ